MEDRLEIPEIDVEKVMQQIRENVSKRRQELPPSQVAGPPPINQVPADLTLLHRNHNIYPMHFTSHRKVWGRCVVLAKKVLQKLLTPILERQLAYNVANTRVTSHLWEQVTTLYQQQAELYQQQADALQALRLIATLRQQQADALQALRAEVDAQVTGDLQQQADTLQALRAEVDAQVTGGLQQQADTLQALRAEVDAQVTGGLQQQADALQALRAEVDAQVTGGLQQQADALQALRAEVGAQGAGGLQQQADALPALRLIATLRQQQADALPALRAEVDAQVTGGLQQQADALQALRLEAEKGAAERDARMVEWERTVARLKTEIILQERRITILLEEARKRLPDPWNQEQVQSVADEVHHVLDALYVSFEDQFRGTREDIKERLRLYLSILQEAKLGSETRPILDVGCGRGEWLELLQENSMWGQGVDRNRVLVEECRGRGLCVIESDVLTYLRTLPDASLGAVTGFHIIEHLPWEVLIKVLDETVRVLTSGGLAIFETPNPQNVLVGSHNFYLDPTHRNPLPSSVMQFIAEARGLCRVQIIELHPYPQASRVQEADLDVAKRFNKYFYGPQDYAVVGWKV